MKRKRKKAVEVISTDDAQSGIPLVRTPVVTLPSASDLCVRVGKWP